MLPAGVRSPDPFSSSRALFLAACAFVAHLPFLHLPYYWDELGQFVPAALDILREGRFIPRSTVPNIHPPAVMAYLAGVWRCFGYHPAVTRAAMLFLACAGLLATIRLAGRLLKPAPAALPLLAAVLLAASPVFFAQSMMAQLDAPALLFTVLAALFFLEERFLLSAAACLLLVLVKETGLVTALVCVFCLARQRRWRAAIPYAAAPIALGLWIAALSAQTGHWLGNADFARYNLYEPMNPLRIAVTLVRRLYFLAIGGFHWIGTLAIVLAWRRAPNLFHTPAWKFAGLLLAAHVALFSLLGGAVLARYLLPVMPVVYIAMAAGIAHLPRRWTRPAAAALAAGLVFSNFVHPPYPFPLEENLAFTDYLELHVRAAGYLERQFPAARVDTMWPMKAELSQPEFGYVRRPLSVRLLNDLAPETLEALDWNGVEVLAAFSRDLPQPAWWSRWFPSPAGVTRAQVRARVPLPLAAGFSSRGQWVDIFAKRTP